MIETIIAGLIVGVITCIGYRIRFRHRRPLSTFVGPRMRYDPPRFARRNKGIEVVKFYADDRLHSILYYKNGRLIHTYDLP